jgi:hypothetical protein
LKVFGRKHCEEMVECMKKSRKVCDLIAGFDMVNEEDTTAPLKDCVSMLDDAHNELRGYCPFYFHGKTQMANLSS